jgi:hypothetical protein
VLAAFRKLSDVVIDDEAYTNTFMVDEKKSAHHTRQRAHAKNQQWQHSLFGL